MIKEEVWKQIYFLIVGYIVYTLIEKCDSRNIIYILFENISCENGSY